jgi:hypothetical protein
VNPRPRLAAQVLCAPLTVVCLFQLSRALGRLCHGGAFPGVFPESMRIAALVQIGVLALAGLVVLSRAGVLLPRWARTSRWLSWVIVGLVGLGVILNLITPSPVERLIWAPVASLLFFSGLRVASSR